jgi:anti-sigma-K factor RskA
MNCNELRDHYELYALGIAEEPERTEIRAHLDRECEVCMTQMKAARKVASMLGGTASPAAPSPRLRRRILASVGAGHTSFGWAAALAALAAVAVCAAFYFSGRERDYLEEARVLREQSRSQTIELTRLTEAFAILNGADTTVTSFGEKLPKPKGTVFFNRSQGLVMIASHLAPAPAGKAYETWMIPKGGKPVRAGMFQSRADGTVMYVQRGAIDTGSIAAFAVTLEVEAGVDAPTSTPLIVAPVPPALQ